jgi:hypothetical protein
MDLVHLYSLLTTVMTVNKVGMSQTHISLNIFIGSLFFRSLWLDFQEFIEIIHFSALFIRFYLIFVS